MTLRGDEVLAPLLGTYYRAPKPGAAPFVDVGSEVSEDTVIGIVEVMKLMNSDTHSCTHSLASLAILAVDGTDCFIIRDTFAIWGT